MTKQKRATAGKICRRIVFDEGDSGQLFEPRGEANSWREGNFELVAANVPPWLEINVEMHCLFNESAFKADSADWTEAAARAYARSAHDGLRAVLAGERGIQINPDDAEEGGS